MTFNLDIDAALALAKPGVVIPITMKVFGGNQTPVGVFDKFSGSNSSTFLLESAEQGIWSRYSFIGIESRNEIIYSDQEFQITNAETLFPVPTEVPSDPLALVTKVQSAWQTSQIEGLPPLTSGLVGLFGWDLIREIENIPSVKNPPYESPTIHLQMVKNLIVIDHVENSLLLVSNLYCRDGDDYSAGYKEAVQQLTAIREILTEPSSDEFFTASHVETEELSTNQSHKEFLDSVLKAKEYVRIGDVFQVVISQRFELEVSAKPVDVYRVLRSINPSPYMYLLNFRDKNGNYSVVGSSPEALVKVEEGSVTMHPIAGSRPRGNSPTEDEELATALLADTKEQAEHLMLVDLARNDLLKVCEPDSISVKKFMKIERFSHVMHLVSDVQGKLRAESNPVELLKATFPAGTLSGAPKPRALEIIEELEPDKRGIFGGVVGYFDFAGNADLAISIRTAFIRNGRAYVQAGAGIVLDSVPESEYQETIAKASAVLRAIKQANSNFAG